MPSCTGIAIALQAEADDKSGIFGSADAPGPPAHSRALAIVHVAMFDAINSIVGQYEPYLIKVVGVQGANIDAAVGTAAHDTLRQCFSQTTAAFRRRFDRLARSNSQRQRQRTWASRWVIPWPRRF